MVNVRNSREIRAELVRRGETITSLAGAAGVSRPLASRTIHGQAHNRRVLRALLAMGVPHKLLALPKDMKGKEAA
ncbi:hypothetical protein JCM15519_04030 [Fundidesulfovibrio butyratiphilus]